MFVPACRRSIRKINPLSAMLPESIFFPSALLFGLYIKKEISVWQNTIRSQIYSSLSLQHLGFRCLGLFSSRLEEIRRSLFLHLSFNPSGIYPGVGCETRTQLRCLTGVYPLCHSPHKPSGTHVPPKGADSPPRWWAGLGDSLL